MAGSPGVGARVLGEAFSGVVRGPASGVGKEGEGGREAAGVFPALLKGCTLSEHIIHFKYHLRASAADRSRMFRTCDLQ